MTKDREIVYMLIQREREAYRIWKDAFDTTLSLREVRDSHTKFLTQLYHVYTEAKSAATSAREILYRADE